MRLQRHSGESVSKGDNSPDMSVNAQPSDSKKSNLDRKFIYGIDECPKGSSKSD